MEQLPIKSAHFVDVDYDREQKILTITFKGDVVYQYSEVPENVYRGLITAESKGIYFSEHIRDKYAYEQIT